MKRLCILGSTGSIGIQALDVVGELNRYGGFPVVVDVLAAHSNIELLEKQIRQFKPQVVAVYDRQAAKALRKNIRDMKIEVLEGVEGLCKAAQWETCDTVLNSVVGMVGLRPTVAAIEAGKTIALANKETLVAGGELVMDLAKRKGVSILPVDSEHSAIFQCLQGCSDSKEIKKIILTASGGPFFGKTAGEMKNVKPRDALKHPNWNMGAKITIDSATLMNKGLELIEAKWLFHVEPEDIEIVVHRESIIHSAVEFSDNCVIAQMGAPDMRMPIQYALTHPQRYASTAPSLSFKQLGALSFYEPDYENFRCLTVAIDAIKAGGLVPAAMNGANEEAVGLFLKEKILFTDIARLVSMAAENQPPEPAGELEAIIEADLRARELVRTII